MSFWIVIQIELRISSLLVSNRSFMMINSYKIKPGKNSALNQQVKAWR